MIVHVDTTVARVGVAATEDLKRLSASINGPAGGRLPDGWGRFDEDGQHLWLSVERLREEASAGQSSEWRAKFEAMLAYAQGKGWMDAGGEHVRVHVE